VDGFRRALDALVGVVANDGVPITCWWLGILLFAGMLNCFAEADVVIIGSVGRRAESPFLCDLFAIAVTAWRLCTLLCASVVGYTSLSLYMTAGGTCYIHQVLSLQSYI
jgi:hypothetical protein